MAMKSETYNIRNYLKSWIRQIRRRSILPQTRLNHDHLPNLRHQLSSDQCRYNQRQ